jgi:hypothetical protein
MISNKGDAPHSTKIVIDGKDVTGCFNSLFIRSTMDSAVEIEMDVPVVTQWVMDRPARLMFPIKETRDLLIEHGWTPPSDEDAA